MKTKTKLDGNSREACCLLHTGVNGVLVELVPCSTAGAVNGVFHLIRVGILPWAATAINDWCRD